MLFWIFVVLLLIGMVCVIIYDHTMVDGWCLDLGVVLTGVSTFVLIIMSIVLVYRYIIIDGYVAQNQVRYESLVYQYENDLYDNDNDVGKKELLSEIQDWNEDLARYKALQKNFWVGIFVPNVYDQFEFIELK